MTHSHLDDGNQAFGTAGKVEAGGWEELLCYLGTIITELQSSIIALQPTFQRQQTYYFMRLPVMDHANPHLVTSISF